MSFIYLASPYSHKCPEVRKKRVTEVAKVAARIMDSGSVVFSPVVHGHCIEMIGFTDPKSHEFWMEQCLGMLSMAKELHVLCLSGWKVSSGVSIEIKFAQDNNIPVYYIDVD